LNTQVVTYARMNGPIIVMGFILLLCATMAMASPSPVGDQFVPVSSVTRNTKFAPPPSNVTLLNV
jgi:hypothetical protein